MGLMFSLVLLPTVVYDSLLIKMAN